MPHHAKAAPQQPSGKPAAKEGTRTKRDTAPGRFRGGLEESNRIAKRIGLKPITGLTGPKVAY